MSPIDEEAVAGVDEYRLAAADLLEARLPRRALLPAIVELAQAAQAEADHWVREIAERVVWTAFKPVFRAITPEDFDEPHAFPPLVYESKQLAVRREGYERCPKCSGPLATEAHARIWQAQREDHARNCRTVALTDLVEASS